MSTNTKATATPSMRQAIVTRYAGATDTRGSRIIARAEAGSVTVPYDHALNSSDNHAAAAQKLADKYVWGGSWIGGAMPNGNGYVWVDASDIAEQWRAHSHGKRGAA